MSCKGVLGLSTLLEGQGKILSEDELPRSFL